MEKHIEFNYDLLKYKYFPLNMDKYKVLVLKLSVNFTEVGEIDIKTGKETLYKLEEMVVDWNPVTMYDYGDYYIVIGQSFYDELRVCKYDKKEKKEVVYNYLKGKAKSVYSEMIGTDLYISVLEEKGRLYTFNIETDTLSICNENEEHYISYLKKIDENLILTHEISLKNKHKQSSIYDDKWRRIESINYNENSDDLCYAQDVKRNIKLVVSNVLGKKELFLQKDNQVSNISICDSLDEFDIEDYIYDKGIIIYKTEKALTYTLNSYDVNNGHSEEIVHDQFVYMIKKIDNRIVIVGNDVNSQLVVSIYDLEENKIIDKYSYPQGQFKNKGPQKKYVEVSGRKVDYIEYPPYDYDNINGYIIYLHGGPEAHWLPKYDEMFSQLQRNNFAVIYPNYFGSSQYGSIDYDKQENKWGIKDLEDILYIRKILNHKNVILMGESYGAYLAMNVWNKNPNDWTGTIVFSSFYTPWSLYENGSKAVKETVKRHIAERDIGCTEMVKCLNTSKVSTKVLILHGKCDEKIPYKQAVSIFEYLNRTYDWDTKPTIKLIDNLGHSIHNISKSFEVGSYICEAIKEIS